MSDPVFLTDRARPAIRVERRYAHPIERVWRAVTRPESLAQWFPVPLDLEPREGGVADFGDSRGRVLEADPPHRLVFSWGEDRLEFDLRADGDGTAFVLTHRFDDRAGAASFATGWEACLDGLAAVLDEAPAPPADRREQRHEQLVERFGLDEPVVTRHESGWRVRIERQLVVAAEVAWRRLAAHPLGVSAVQVELGAGTGHGARLVLAVSGTDDHELQTATAWARATVRAVAGAQG